MNKILKLSAAASLLLTLQGCAVGSIKPSPPSDPSAAGVVIRIANICLPLMPCGSKTLTFARLSEDGDVISDEIYQTAVERDNHYYLLNATPGTYVAVAATYTRNMQTSSNLGGGFTMNSRREFGENILFPDEMVRQTQVEVRPGALAVMGEYDFGIKGRMAFAPSAAGFIKEADPVQLHYAKALDPDMESRGVTSAIKFYRAVLESSDNSATAKKNLLRLAEKHIGMDGWEIQINNSSPVGSQ